VFLPSSAIVWYGGDALAYVATGPNRFSRRVVRLARSVEGGYLATSGLIAGERLVTRGAQQLLSSQLLTPSARD
jgi:hypothetical protein